VVIPSNTSRRAQTEASGCGKLGVWVNDRWVTEDDGADGVHHWLWGGLARADLVPCKTHRMGRGLPSSSRNYAVMRGCVVGVRVTRNHLWPARTTFHDILRCCDWGIKRTQMEQSREHRAGRKEERSEKNSSPQHPPAHFSLAVLNLTVAPCQSVLSE